MSKASLVPYSDNKDWQADQDMRALLEAAEIRKDPARLKAALACAKKKSQELTALSETKK
jgi:hypothetical protein